MLGDQSSQQKLNPYPQPIRSCASTYTTLQAPLQAPKMSFTASLPDAAILEKLEKLTSSFAVLALAMKQSSDEFKDAALQFSSAMDAIRAAPAFIPMLSIDTATPAAEKAAAAVRAAPAFVLPPSIDTATPAAAKAAAAVADAERDAHYAAMEECCEDYKERLRHLWSYEMRMKVGRMNDYRDGCIRTLTAANGSKQRVLIYKYHAFEMPTDHPYHRPGPLISIGAIDPESKAIKPLLTPPELPAAVDWPWH